MFLKNRILNDKGHLNNEYSARLMCEVIGEKTKEIVLAHLSQEVSKIFLPSLTLTKVSSAKEGL